MSILPPGKLPGERNGREPVVPLPALKTIVWKAGPLPELGLASVHQQLVAELDPETGITIALMMITFRTGVFLSITNVDSDFLRSEGLFYLFSQGNKKRAFLSKSKAQEILHQFSSFSQKVEASTHLYEFTNTTLKLAHISGNGPNNVLDMVPEEGREFDRLTGSSRFTDKDLFSLDSIEDLPVSEADRPDIPIRVSSFSRSAPVYSKLLVVRVRHNERWLPFFTKHTSSHFEHHHLERIKKGSRSFSIIRTYRKSAGYQSVSLALNPTAGVV